jgi:hypothetical protein
MWRQRLVSAVNVYIKVNGAVQDQRKSTFIGLLVLLLCHDVMNDRVQLATGAGLFSSGRRPYAALSITANRNDQLLRGMLAVCLCKTAAQHLEIALSSQILSASGLRLTSYPHRMHEVFCSAATDQRGRQIRRVGGVPHILLGSRIVFWVLGSLSRRSTTYPRSS